MKIITKRALRMTLLPWLQNRLIVILLNALRWIRLLIRRMRSLLNRVRNATLHLKNRMKQNVARNNRKQNVKSLNAKMISLNLNNRIRKPLNRKNRKVFIRVSGK